MVSIKIGNIEKKLDAIDSEWIHQQINNRRSENENVCIQVIIHYDSINIALMTDGCPKGLYANRKISKNEKDIFDLWEHMGLNKQDFLPNKLIDFLLKLHNYR